MLKKGLKSWVTARKCEPCFLEGKRIYCIGTKVRRLTRLACPKCNWTTMSVLTWYNGENPNV